MNIVSLFECFIPMGAACSSVYFINDIVHKCDVEDINDDIQAAELSITVLREYLRLMAVLVLVNPR